LAISVFKAKQAYSSIPMTSLGFGQTDYPGCLKNDCSQAKSIVSAGR